MFYLLASIASSTAILVLFRLLDKSSGVTPHAIVVNYLAAAIAGALYFRTAGLAVTSHWFWVAAVEGLAFFLVFRLMGLTAQKNGIAVASIATKMSVVIPVAIGLVALGESVDTYKLLGIAAGVLSVLLASGDRVSLANWTLPLLVFVCTGLIDASFKLFQVWGLTDPMFPAFIVTVFGFAFVAAVISHLVRSGRFVSAPSVGFGILLGMANFGTVFFIMKALANMSWESSVIFPLNHFGVVVASTVVAVVFFRERPGILAAAGLCLAVLSILLLYLSGVGPT